MKKNIPHNGNYIKELLYKSFDSILSEKEKTFLKEELEKSDELKKLQNEILSLRNRVKNSAYTEFNPYFETRLLNKIYQSSRQNGLLTGLYDSVEMSFKKIALTAAAILLLLVLYNVTEGNISSIEALLGIYQTPIEYALDPAIHILGSEI